MAQLFSLGHIAHESYFMDFSDFTASAFIGDARFHRDRKRWQCCGLDLDWMQRRMSRLEHFYFSAFSEVSFGVSRRRSIQHLPCYFVAGCCLFADDS